MEEQTIPGPGTFPPVDTLSGRIGRFVPVKPVGEGSLGRVYAAYDPQLDRQVAIKILKRRVGKTARQAVLREAKALAKLNHPNVVQIYDVGEHGDRLFIAMELVHGETLARWQHDRSWREVFHAYLEAGEGLAASHAAGLVHRDFKPHNAIVETAAGGRTRVRVLDFGLARYAEGGSAIPPEVAAPTLDPSATATGAVAGTPAYMAPEQFARGNVGPAADQFAFCVALWEGLYGARPFPGHTLPEIMVSVVDGVRQPPPRRLAVPSFIRRALVRGLDPRPEARWPAMDALLSALRREPERRRRRIALGGLGTVAVVLVGLGAWFGRSTDRCSAEGRLDGIWDEARAEQVRTAMLATGAPYADAAWTTTQAEPDAYADRWATMYVEACEATARGEHSEEALDLRMVCLQSASQRLARLVDVYAASDEGTVAHANDLHGALSGLTPCADIKALRGRAPHEDHSPTADAMRDLLLQAQAARLAGDPKPAAVALSEARRLADAVRDEELLAGLEIEEGRTYADLGEFARAEELLRAALRRAARAGLRSQHWRAATNLMYVVGRDLRRPAEALRYRDTAEALADSANERVISATTVALVLLTDGRFEDAEKHARRALAAGESLPPTSLLLVKARDVLAAALRDQGEYAEADEELALISSAQTERLGEGHPLVVSTLINRANVWLLQKRFSEAEAAYKEALARYDGIFSAGDRRVVTVMNNLAISLQGQGRLEDAEATYRDVLVARQRNYGLEHAAVARAHFNVASVLVDAGRLWQAELQHRFALSLRERVLRAEHPEIATSQTALADLLVRRGALDEARALAELAWQRRTRGGVQPRHVAHTAFVLARALWPTDPQRARSLAERAAHTYEDAGEAYAGEEADVRAWLAAR